MINLLFGLIFVIKLSSSRSNNNDKMLNYRKDTSYIVKTSRVINNSKKFNVILSLITFFLYLEDFSYN